MMFLGWPLKYLSTKETHAEVAREWMANNEKTVDGWLGL